jgi:hypothetical protein
MSRAPAPNPGSASPAPKTDGLLTVIRNLSQYHREHEKYYSEAPLADAIALQRAARTLIALAETMDLHQACRGAGSQPFRRNTRSERRPRAQTAHVPFLYDHISNTGCARSPDSS